ncbi:pickpocket protein 28-like [Anopheles marshallii]|uniref:pickpocket protein 28-like n=1 Tax=Anopheles marshallii TaxID=1521116 RepID=UPI00237A3E5E|nr:pickpocket protein 28-like [Anopheles marshallii]
MVETKFVTPQTSDPRNGSNIWEPELLNESYKDNGQRSLWVDYCANSTIHGFKYLVGDKRTAIERIWWIIVCLLSLFGCGNLIYSVYRKWDREPVVVTFAEKPAPVFTIPFPAVTICPETKVRKKDLDFTKAYQFYNDPQGWQFMAREQVAKLEALLQVCDFSFGIEMNDDSYSDNVVEYLQKLAIPFEDIFLMCSWREHVIDCKNFFKQTITDAGICYTFNSLAADDLLRREQLHTAYEYMAENESSKMWNMDDGYSSGAGGDTYPRRAFGAGRRAGLVVILKVQKYDMDFLCGNSFQGFKVHLHSPVEYPRMLNQFFRIPLSQEVSVSVEPLLLDTAPNIRRYRPQRRLCYYNHERHLRYFKVYSKCNCDIECLSNYTLKTCGCVPFPLPHTNEARVCGLGKASCADEALSVLEEMDLIHELNKTDNFLEHCNCLQACNALIYNTEISQAIFDWRKLSESTHIAANVTNETELSYLSIHFKVSRFIPIKRSELFGISDFLANCGGVLGLFMGVSILSIVEIVYYCTLKPIMARTKASARPETAQAIKPALIFPPKEFGPTVGARLRNSTNKW